MSHLRIATYKPGDEKHIVDLFAKCFPNRTISPAYWNWRFLENPAGTTDVLLAWDNHKLVAHYAVSPFVLAVDSAEYTAALSMTTMTLAEYRGQAIFPRLASRMYENLAQKDYFAVVGFPNNLSHRGFVSRLGWNDIYEIPTMIMRLSEINQPQVPPHVLELNLIDSSFDALWQQIPKSELILTKRDKSYLQWRIADNPVARYKVFGFIVDESLLGYAVTSVYRQNELQVVDILSLDDMEVYHGLIQALIGEARKAKLKSIKTWMPLHNRFHRALERHGFANSEPVTYFGARILSEPLRLDIWDVRRWYYTMSDSDNF